MDRVMRRVPGYWAGQGRAGHSSIGCLCALLPAPCSTEWVGVVIVHSFGLDSSGPLESLTYLCVENWRHGGLLRSSDLAGI